MNERNLSGLVLAGRGTLVLTGLLLVAVIGCRNHEGTSLTPGVAGNRPSASGAPPNPDNSATPLIPTELDGPVQTMAPAISMSLPAIPPTHSSLTRSPQSQINPTDLLTLEVMAPLNASGLEVGFVRVIGTTTGTSATINGLPVKVAEDGGFQQDLSLGGGVNLIEVVASDALGRTASQQLTVFVVAPTASLPFSIVYPRDGLEVFEPRVILSGVTRPDAVVGVNDVPVATNASGIFSTEVELEKGANLIEVVAADINGNVRFQTVAVFYIP